MMQQYVLMRKENDLLNSLIGQSFNEKSKFEAYKILKQIHKQADQYSMEKALCYIVDIGEIKGVGGSSLMKNKKTGEIVSDLVLDQFGNFLAGITKNFAGGVRTAILKNNAGALRTLEIYTTSNVANFNRTTIGARGALIQVGSGSTPPARTDFKIETVFGTAPESALFNAPSSPVYNSGLGNFKYNASISAGGSGTINESILSYSWVLNNANQEIFTAFRDIISPAQAFIAGQTIALEYTIQL